MRRFPTVCGLVAVVLLLVACGAEWENTMPASQVGRWACPSPMPQPYGEAGPVKGWEEVPLPTTVPTGTQEYERVPIYYEQWEREYPDSPNAPPFPSPTPYGFTGKNFVFRQRVELAPFHLTVNATAGPRVTLPIPDSEALQLYTVELTWDNPLANPVAVDYAAQLRLRAITLPNGAERTDSGWSPSGRALEAAGIRELPRDVPPGTSTVEIPVLAPPGQPKIVEFSMPTADNRLLATPGASNPDLQRPEQRYLTIQWSNSGFDFFGAPPCNSPGALTDWGSGALPPIGANAPPGATRVVEIALNQLGKPYVWGAKGPETFDCSGLVAWAYAQIGIHLPSGTVNQWPLMRPVAAAQVQDGDLAFFDTVGGGQITHVGMVFLRDGHWKLVHAASPQLGVREDALDSSYYRTRLMGFRTAR